MWSTWITICKTPRRYLCNTLANTCFIFSEKPPSFLEILFMIPVNIISPFLYVMDIVKDLVQFGLFVVAVGGLSKFLEYWSSFSSMVSTIYIYFLSWITYHTFGSVWFSNIYCNSPINHNPSFPQPFWFCIIHCQGCQNIVYMKICSGFLK